MNFFQKNAQQRTSMEWLSLAVIVSLIIRLAVAYWLPLTGDEAYFVTWGKNLDYGYYDHPPMVGWFLSFLLLFSDAAVWLRLPGILMFSFMAVVIYRLLKDFDEKKALLAAVLFLFVPLNLLSVLITTDTPLILFSFISAIYFYHAQQNDSFKKYLLAGFFLGLAFYSKFFAGLLGIAYFFYLVFFVRMQRGFKPYIGILLVLLAVSPFIILNIVWNYNNCWNNYLFNLLNRTSDAEFSFYTLGIYLALLAYLMTPPVIWYAFKQPKEDYRAFLKQPLGVFIALFAIPLILFLFLSFFKKIGLHWMFSFYPFMFIAAGYLFSYSQLLKTIKFIIPFSIVHLGLLAFIVITGPSLVEKNENTYKDFLYGVKNDVILEKLAAYRNDYTFATDSYVGSALLSYTSREHVLVLGHGSHHAREDDKRTDFRKLEGKNIVVVSFVDTLDYLNDAFESLEIKPLQVEQATFYYAVGKGFKYKGYRETIIQNTLDRYYRIPSWLPTGQCYMNDWYR